ncbi:MAG: glutamate--tRNA ligase [Planctomycetes bacterium]|nr:glutamate--tRNA ligase [Planctomycetota bacterium]MCP4839041.1 glutamate--tRNA ligase [Planctomycetota bacterium]
MSVRTRFAPSPSGHLHVGGARSALFCWAYAANHDGTLLLRIEDTDQKRSSDAASRGFLEDLAWLGLDWDEGPQWHGRGGGDTGPYEQSNRLDIYEKYLAQLIDSGHAYRAFETPEELAEARRAARQEKRAYRYDRAALDLDPDTVAAWVAQGRPFVVRFKVPGDAPIVIQDAVLGEVRVEPGELEDFIIRKADGFPTYHLAVVVDDQLMGVTHVIRGQEHLANSPKHALLQDALGFDRPIWAHVSLIFNPDGSKMSKRDKDKALRAEVRSKGIENPPEGAGIEADRWQAWLGDKTMQLETEEATRLAGLLGIQLPAINVDDFRRSGYLPEVLLNYLALLGWSPGGDREQFDLAFIRENFSLDRIVKSPAKFDRAKLLAFNLDAIQAMDDDQFVVRLQAFCQDFEPAFLEAMTTHQFKVFALANKARSKTFLDPIESGRFFVQGDDEIEWPLTKPLRKALCKGEPCGFDRLTAVRDILAEADSWTPEHLETILTTWAETHCEGNLGKVAQPIRVAVSGGSVSPPIFDTLEILGKDATLTRIDRCLSQRESMQESST